MAKGVQGITNIYLYNRFMNDINDSATANVSDDTTLRYVIDETNSLIAQKCGRTFALTTYKEWVDAVGERYVVLKNYPITNIKLVAGSGIDLFTVKATGFQLATVSSNNSSMTLSSIDTTGSEVDTVLDYATNANVSSMVTSIDLVSGWDANTLGDRGDSLTQLIRPIDSGWCLDQQTYMKGPYLGNSVRVSLDSDSTIESIGGGRFSSDIFVWYSAGYTLPVCDDVGGTLTTDGNVPEGLTMTANRIVKDYLEQRNEDTNMLQEDIGDYKYIRGEVMSCVDRHWKDLQQYSRKVV